MHIYKSQVGGWSSYRGERKLFHEAANVTNGSVADVSLKYSFTAAKSSAYMIYDLPYSASVRRAAVLAPVLGRG